MNGIALRMLLGDRAKYIGLIFGIAFSTMLMSNQVAIFSGLMLRTASQILNAREADIWVMDPRVEYVDEIEPMTDTQLERGARRIWRRLGRPVLQGPDRCTCARRATAAGHFAWCRRCDARGRRSASGFGRRRKPEAAGCNDHR